MQVRIKPSTLHGAIQAPASKSSMQRACAAALLRNGDTIIENPGHANDDRAALTVIEALGAVVHQKDDGSLLICSHGLHPTAQTVNCGESGLGIRMFAPIIALSNQDMLIRGEGSLLGRPMDFFDTVLPDLGVQVVSNNGRLPLKIRGPLKPADIEIDGSLSSQFLTGLLMAYAAAGASKVTISVKDLKSKPYIDLTLQVMEHFGWKVENRGYREFYFGEAPSFPPGDGPLHYKVEGDWSGGAFLLVAGAIAGNIRIKGLDTASTQADKAMLMALNRCGAAMTTEKTEISIGPSSLRCFEFDATDCPDLFPPLAALAAYCKGTTVIRGVGRLAHKESNRALTLQEEFRKMGTDIELRADEMHIHGTGRLSGAEVHSRHDHRIAMACAVAALGATGDTIIEEAQAVSKSYPDFYQDIAALGAVVE